MRTSSNPAFRNLPSGQGGYATFDRQGGAMGGAAAYADASAGEVEYGRAGVGERPITVDDVVLKTSLSAGVALIAGIITAVTGLYALALPAFVVGFVVSLVLIFKQKWAGAPLVLLYSAAMGVALGGLAGFLETRFPGIAFQALLGTAGVFVGMLVVYKTGAVRVTPRFTKWLIGAMIGILGLVVINFVLSLFGVDMGIRSAGPLGIIFSLIVIGVAAFCLLLDFDAADQAVRAGAPAKVSWYIAFGLMTTLVWLYLEILRLLSYLRQD